MTMIGYTLFFFLRKNFSFAMPGLAQDYGITKTSLGLFLTLHGVVYGLAKFANGWVGDRVKPRGFLMTVLLACLALNSVRRVSAPGCGAGVSGVRRSFRRVVGSARLRDRRRRCRRMALRLSLEHPCEQLRKRCKCAYPVMDSAKEHDIPGKLRHDVAEVFFAIIPLPFSAGAGGAFRKQEEGMYHEVQ